MGATPGERPTVETTRDRRFPEFVDWILGGFVALIGLSLLLGGSAMALFVDRDAIAQGIEDESVTVTVGTTELTDAQALEVTEAVAFWTEIGLLVTGVVLILAAITYVANRHHAYGQAEGEGPVSTYGPSALIGALATVVLSFIAISPLFGGALAGYIERDGSGRAVSVGALAGVLPTLPLALLLAFVLGGVIAGLLTIGESGWAIFVGAAIVITMLFVVIVTAALGALGGYVGGRIAGGGRSAEE